MGTKYVSVTYVAPHGTVSRSDLLKNWNQLDTAAAAMLFTASRSDGLMSDVQGFCSVLKLSSLSWLATNGDLEDRMLEQEQDIQGYWWWVWVMAPNEIEASLRDLNEILHLMETNPSMAGVSADELRAAIDIDGHKSETDFDLPVGFDGNEPHYVLSALLSLRRLLRLAIANSMQVVHFKHSHRPSKISHSGP